MEIKLKPCPFCGARPFIFCESVIGFSTHARKVLYQVECTECFANIDGCYDSEQEAAEAWNRRAVPERPVVHAKWVTDDFTKLIICSACGFDTGMETTSGKQWKAPYCWYCGAKMDGDS